MWPLLRVVAHVGACAVTDIMQRFCNCAASQGVHVTHVLVVLLILAPVEFTRLQPSGGHALPVMP